MAFILPHQLFSGGNSALQLLIIKDNIARELILNLK